VAAAAGPALLELADLAAGYEICLMNKSIKQDDFVVDCTGWVAEKLAAIPASAPAQAAAASSASRSRPRFFPCWAGELFITHTRNERNHKCYMEGRSKPKLQNTVTS